jgi:hypothetical protein
MAPPAAPVGEERCSQWGFLVGQLQNSQKPQLRDSPKAGFGQNLEFSAARAC